MQELLGLFFLFAGDVLVGIPRVLSIFVPGLKTIIGRYEKDCTFGSMIALNAVSLSTLATMLGTILSRVEEYRAIDLTTILTGSFACYPIGIALLYLSWQEKNKINPYDLLPLLISNDWEVQTRALKQLEKYDPDWPKSPDARRFVPEFVSAVNHPDGLVRTAAVEALGRIGAKRAVLPLISALEDSHTQKLAAEALGNFCDRRAISPLIEKLGSDDQSVRVAVLSALTRIDPDWVNHEKAKSRIHVLLDALKDKNQCYREVAFRALKRMDADWMKNEETRKHVPHYIDSLEDGDGDIRAASATALGLIGDFRAVDPLVSCLGSGNELFQKEVLTALERILPDWLNSKAAHDLLPELIRLLQYGDNAQRKAAVETLRLIGDKRVLPALVRIRMDPDAYVRKSAEIALTEMDPNWPKSDTARKQMPEFMKALKDKDTFVRKTAAEVLTRIDHQWTKSPEALDLIPECIAALKTWDVKAREIAAEILAAIGDTQGIDPLLDALKDADLYTEYYNMGNNFSMASSKDAGMQVVTRKNNFIDRAILEIIRKNQPFPENYSDLFCPQCLRRAAKKKIVLHPNFALWPIVNVAACPKCGGSVNLSKDVKIVRGVVGGDVTTLRKQGKTAIVPIWNESEKTAICADIDMLEIREGGVANHHLAINAVILELAASETKKNGWIKQIPVRITGNPGMPGAVMNMLKDNFDMPDGMHG